MDHAFLVGRLDALGDLLGDGERLCYGYRSSIQSLRQRLALNIFEDQVLLAVRFLQSVNRGDVGVVQ